jgi:hypothetical protein
VFIKHPPENSMASLSFTSTMLNEGTTFIFGTWICVTNGLGGFNSHRADSKKLETSTPTRCSDLNEFVNNLDDFLLPDQARQIERMSVFDTTSTRAAPEQVESDSNRSEETTQFEFLSNMEEDLDRLLKLEDVGAIACRGAPSLTTTRTPTKSIRQLVLHLQARAKEDLRMREPPLVGRPLFSTTTCNLMTTPNPFWVVT